MKLGSKHDYKIIYEDRKDYLYVHISGPESFQAAVNFWMELENKLKTKNTAKIMVVDEVTGELDIMKHYEISTIVAEKFVEIKIAFIDPKKNTFELNKFGGEVVNSQGGFARVFRSETEGLEWLLNENSS